MDFDNLCKKYQLLKFGYIIAKYCLKDIPTVRKTPPTDFKIGSVCFTDQLCVYIYLIFFIYIYFRGVHICIPWILIFDHVCDRLSHFCKKNSPILRINSSYCFKDSFVCYTKIRFWNITFFLFYLLISCAFVFKYFFSKQLHIDNPTFFFYK